MKLARRLSPENINGRVIILPGLNLPALQAGTRLSPIDSKDLNRVFPGDPQGTISQITREPLVIHAARPGRLIIIRSPGPAEIGDCLAVVAGISTHPPKSGLFPVRNGRARFIFKPTQTAHRTR